MEVKISKIIVGKRARVSNGSLETLERSIDSLGVLHPIGITPDKKLIFGGRRLQACKNLGLDTIPARIFDINADDPVTALRMERAENEGRIDLTPSEKVAIAWRIEQAMEGRAGGDTSKGEQSNPQNFADWKGQESRDIAAKAVGMNRETYRQAKAVVNSGNQEEIQAMDSGEKSINAAYNSINNKPKPRTFKITLYNNPHDDAEVLIVKAGNEYCTKLALAILKAAGHSVKEFDR